jgi:hypothetical protein
MRDMDIVVGLALKAGDYSGKKNVENIHSFGLWSRAESRS